MAVVPVEAPRLQHAIDVAVLARTADVIHDLALAALDDRAADPAADVLEHFVPRHALPLARATRARALQRIQDAIRILELIRRDDALRARATAAPRMDRIAFDLAD